MNCRENLYIFLTPQWGVLRQKLEASNEREAGRERGARAKPGNQLVFNNVSV